MLVATDYRNPVRGDVDNDHQQKMLFEPLTSFVGQEYIPLRVIFGEKAQYEPVQRIIEAVKPYAARYQDFLKKNEKVKDQVDIELEGLGFSLTYDRILKDHTAAIASVQGGKGKDAAAMIIDLVYILNGQKDQYVQDVKKAVYTCMNQRVSRKRDIAKGIAVRSIGYLFGGIVAAFNPAAGISLILGTTGEIARYSMTEAYHRVDAQRDVQEDQKLLSIVQLPGVEAILKDMSLYPEKVDIDLAGMRENDKLVLPKPRLKHRYQRMRLKK